MPNTIPSSTLEKFTTFGDLLRFLRRRAGITQLEFSIAVGYSDSQISRLEQNMRLPDPAVIEARFEHALHLEDEPRAVARLLELATRESIQVAPTPGKCPYKGLDYFDEVDADLFVGREALTKKISDRVLTFFSKDQAPHVRFFSIVGPSGSGKSSLVRAGLLPVLRRSKTTSGWSFILLTPSLHPLENLAYVLLKGSSLSATSSLLDNLLKDPCTLHRYLQQEMKRTDGSGILMVVDQFEECFAHCSSERERSAFIANLMKAASAQDGKAIVIIILRADFYVYCASYPVLRDALAKNQEYLGEMSKEEMRRAIEEPARFGQWEFESGLVDLILHDVSHEPGSLPLLSHALYETWQRRHGRTMTLKGYISAGGVRGAIAETAEAVFTDQFTPTQQMIARRIFVRLTELGDENDIGDTSRRVSLDELISKSEESEAVRIVLKTLADARLVTIDENSVQVTHEALIREWPTLRNWLEENREGLRLHRHLTVAANDWQAAGCEPGLLFRGVRLAQAHEWAASHPDDLNTLEIKFLDASTAYSQREIAEREAQQQRELEAAQKLAEIERQRAEEGIRSTRRIKQRSILISVIGILATALAIFGLFAWQRAVIQAAVNRSMNLASVALQRYQSGQVDLALLLAQEAVRVNPQSPEAIKVLRKVALSPGTRALLTGHTHEVSASAISPDVNTVFSTSCARIDDRNRCLVGELILWDLDSGKEIRRWLAHSSWITAVAYSSDGQTIISGSQDGSLILWDLYGHQIGQLLGHHARITDLVAQQESTFLLSGAEDGYLILWDLKTNNVVKRFALTDSPITAIAIASDVPTAVTAHRDGSIMLWDLNNRQPVQIYKNQGNSIKSIVLSPDGRRILFISSGMPDLSLRMISVLNGEMLKQQLFACVPNDLAVNPDITYALITCSATILQMDLQNWTVQKRFSGQGEIFTSIFISQDGRYSLSAAKDGTLRIWNMSDELEYNIIPINADILNSIAVSTDGKYLILNDAEKDGITRPALWNIAQRKVISTYSAFRLTANPGGIAISPDNRFVAAIGIRKTLGFPVVTLWNLQTGELFCTYSIYEKSGGVLVFSPDGRFLLAGTQVLSEPFGQLLLIDTETCDLVRQFKTTEDVSSIDVSSDGRRAITGSGSLGRVILWDVSSGEEIKRFSYADNGPVNAVAFGPGDLTVLGSGVGELYLWDLPSGRLLHTYTGLTDSPWSVAISPDGNYILSGTMNGELILWDFDTEEELHHLQVNLEISSVLFTPDGKTAYAAAMEGNLVELQITEKSLPELQKWIAANRYVREFTCAERQRFHLGKCVP